MLSRIALVAPQRVKGKGKEASTQVRNDRILCQGDGGGKKWLNPEHIVKVGLRVLVDGLSVA